VNVALTSGKNFGTVLSGDGCSVVAGGAVDEIPVTCHSEESTPPLLLAVC